MKRIGTIAFAALLVGSVVGGYSAQAQEETAKAINEKEQATTNFMSATGIIQEIEKEEAGIRVTIENEDEMVTILRI